MADPAPDTVTMDPVRPGDGPGMTRTTPDMQLGNQTVPGQDIRVQAKPDAQDADTQHHSMLGRAMRTIMGSPVSYRVNPQTGETEQVQTPQKPGTLWRSILAGAILGGAVGSESKTFAQGAARGAGAVQQRGEQMDEQRRQQAQQEYKNQLEAQKNQREQGEFEQTQQLRKAQIAMYNAQTLRENQLAQGQDFEFHQKLAEAGNVKIGPYKEAGIQPVFSNIPESQHDQLMKDPSHIGLDWEPTGTKISVDEKGVPHYELTYSAYDPSKKVEATPEFVKMAQDAVKGTPEEGLYGNLKPGYQMSPEEFITMKHHITDATNTKQEKEFKKGQLQEQQARIRKDSAEASHYLMENAKARAETSKNAEYHSALTHLDQVGGDFSQLKPSERLTLAEGSTKVVSDLNQAINSAVNAGNMSEAEDLMHQRDNVVKLQGSAFTYQQKNPTPAESKAATTASIADTNKQLDEAKKKGDAATAYNLQTRKNLLDDIKDMDPQKKYETIRESNIPEDQKLALAKQVGAEVSWDIVEETVDAQNQALRQQGKPANVTPDQVARTFQNAGLKVEVNTPERENRKIASEEMNFLPD